MKTLIAYLLLTSAILVVLTSIYSLLSFPNEALSTKNVLSFWFCIIGGSGFSLYWGRLLVRDFNASKRD